MGQCKIVGDNGTSARRARSASLVIRNVPFGPAVEQLPIEKLSLSHELLNGRGKPLSIAQGR